MTFLLLASTSVRLFAPLGSGPVTCWSIIVPRISRSSPSTVLYAAQDSVPPAGVLEPVLMPLTLSPAVVRLLLL